jgi:CheY-like chemotaxis protein
MTKDKVNVLLVDDRPENLLSMAAVLEPLGERLVTAGSGEEALKRLLEDDFAVVLLDVQMPGMDGFETASYTRRLEKTRHVPIIFVTAIDKEERHVSRGYAEGAIDFIAKRLRSRSSALEGLSSHRPPSQVGRAARKRGALSHGLRRCGYGYGAAPRERTVHTGQYSPNGDDGLLGGAAPRTQPSRSRPR